MASKPEIRATFENQDEYLLWMALFITNNAASARSAINNATELSTTGGQGVFHDWLLQWAKSATIRSAAAIIRDQVRQSAEEHKREQCEHGDHAPLSNAEVNLIQAIDQKSIGDLDSLARTILVFRGIGHASVQDCVIELGVSRKDVTAAYCRALTWARAHCPQLNDAEGDRVMTASDRF